MITRVSIGVFLLGSVLFVFGVNQDSDMVTLLGVFLMIGSLIVGYYGFKNKRGMGFLRRL